MISNHYLIFYQSKICSMEMTKEYKIYTVQFGFPLKNPYFQTPQALVISLIISLVITCLRALLTLWRPHHQFYWNIERQEQAKGQQVF